MQFVFSDDDRPVSTGELIADGAEMQHTCVIKLLVVCM